MHAEPSAVAAATAAARHVAQCLATAIRARGIAVAALSGGASPLPMFTALARAALDWSAVHVFQVDERCVPAGDPARNVLAIERALASRGPLPHANLHPMPVEGADHDAASAAYAEELRALAGDPPGLDVVHLGLGADGHTASLFAGDGATAVRDRPVALTGEHAGYRRMTLTLPVLDAARAIVWLVTGGGKAAALRDLLDRSGAAPAGQVRRSNAIVFADPAALAAARGNGGSCGDARDA